MIRRTGRRDHRPGRREIPPVPVNDVAVMPGCCIDTPESIAEMRQLTHDELLRRAAGVRTSGVRWMQWKGAEALKVLHEKFSEGRNPDDVAAYTEFLR